MHVLRVLLASALVLLSIEAQASTLQGGAYCSGAPMNGATLDAVSLATGLLTNSATTDENGHYSLDLPNGVYALTVTPPVGSDCAQQTIDNKQVVGNQQYDILLVRPGDPPPPPTTYVVDGTVTHDGVPLPGIQVQIFGGANANTSTDENGHWSVTIVASDVTVRFRRNTSSPIDPPMPRNVTCNVPLTIDGNLTFDYAIDTVGVTGTVSGDPSTNPKVGVSVSISGSAAECSFSDSQVTDENGHYVSRSLANGHVSVSTGSAIGQYNGASNDSDTFDDDLVLDLVVQEVTTVPVSGRLLGYQGAPISNPPVRLTNDQGQTLTLTPDAEGNFAFDAVPGFYHFRINSSNTGAGDVVPRRINCEGDVEIVEGSYLDFALPVAQVRGDVLGITSLTPVPNVRITGNSFLNQDETIVDWAMGFCSQSNFNHIFSDENGAWGPVALMVGPADLSADGIAGQFGATAQHIDHLVRDDVTVVALRASELSTFTVTGHVTGHEGAPIPFANVTFNGPQSFTATADEQGAYSVDVIPGEYSTRLSGSNPGGHAAPASSYNCSSETTWVVEGPTTIDFAVPYARVIGRITSAALIPIEGVRVRVTNFGSFGGWGCSQNSTVFTDGDGRYDFALNASNANFSFTPPSGSGYINSSLGTTVDGVVNQQVILQLPDIVPPVITTGPLVIHHSDTSVSIQWATNEVTDAKLEHELGSTLATPTVLTRASLATNHLFTLTGLVPETEYAFRVSGKDGGNNTVASAIETFVTTRDPDTAPPLITSGPTAIYVSPILIRIGWSTNEPADSVVTISSEGQSDRVVSAATFVLDHDIVVNGLTPGTLYVLSVSSSDPDHNTSLPVDPVEVRTPAIVDTIPPVISNLRSECITATVMSICWDTDESSTSAIGYINQNDNSAAGVSSSTLTTTHCLAASNLQPSTPYTVAVSSTDGGGNTGNGGPIVVETLSEEAGGEPIISDLFAAAVGATGARVTWQTDRPASTLVQYGTDPLNMSSTAGNISASETGHTVLLSGLPASVTTYVRVVSTNQCGQTTTSDPVPVTDVDECLTGTAGCDAHADCTHTTGSTTCTCASGYSGNGTHCCAICTGGRERATDCGAVADSGCDFRPTIAPQTLQALTSSPVGSAVGTVVANDQDAGDVLTFAILSGNTGGAFAIAGNVLEVASPSAVDARVGGSFTLAVRVLDALGLGATTTVTVEVQQRPGPCANSPCAHGTCVENGDVADCDCTGSGYEGALCATDINECSFSNGGCEEGCDNDPGSFHCTCASGVVAADGLSCLAAGECASVATCDEVAQDLVFFGVVTDESGAPVGSIKCTRAATGGVTCDNEGGELVVSPVLWCTP